MADWIVIPDSDQLPGKPVRSADLIAMKDNVTALAEGASGSPKILTAALNNYSVTTIKLTYTERMTTTNVGLRTAALAVYAVGSYIFAAPEPTDTDYSPGTIIAGSLLNPATISISQGGSATGWGGTIGGGISGSWRCMGYSVNYGYTFQDEQFRGATLWLRIS